MSRLSLQLLASRMTCKQIPPVSHHDDSSSSAIVPTLSYNKQMTKNAPITSSRKWLYLIVITACILQHDATNDRYPAMSGETSRSGTTPVSNPPILPAGTTDDQGRANHVSVMFHDDQYRLDRHYDMMVSSDAEDLRGGAASPVGASTCPADIVLMTKDVTSTHLARNPITIISQDEKTVTFTISNPFGIGRSESLLDTTSSTLFYQYTVAQTGATKCEAMIAPAASSSSSMHLPPVEITAHCMTSPSRHSSLAIVDVWVVLDPSARRKTTTTTVIDIDHADNHPLPEKCFQNIHEKKEQHHHGSILSNHGGLLSYSYKIYCQSQCAAPKTLLLESKDDPERDDKGTFSSKTLNSNDKQDSFLCEAKDFPCGGDGRMVQVCHYSTRDGYRTHCIPPSEAKSLIGYFWKDYCGPCVVEREAK